MQRFLAMISEKIAWWFDFGYGEITAPLTSSIGKTMVLGWIHLFLAIALVAPVMTTNKNLGLLGWALSGIYLLWNIVLDEHGGAFLRPIRQKIWQLEQPQALSSSTNAASPVFRYIRIWVLVGLTVLVCLLWGILYTNISLLWS